MTNGNRAIRHLSEPLRDEEHRGYRGCRHAVPVEFFNGLETQLISEAERGWEDRRRSDTYRGGDRDSGI